jgi:hypothetical protein
MNKIQFFVSLYLLIFIFSCKPDKDIALSDAQKIIGTWEREFVEGGFENAIDTIKYSIDTVFTRDNKFLYKLNKGNIIYIDKTDTLFNVPYKFDGNDNLRLECYRLGAVTCYYKLTRIK